MIWKKSELIQKIWNRINWNKKFWVYAGCGAIATAVDTIILFTLTNFFNFWYFNAAVIGYVTGVIINFTLNKFITFQDYSRKFLKQLGVFTIVALIGLGFNQLIIYSLVEFMGLWYLTAKVIAIIVVVNWSFYGHKTFTFSAQ